MIDDPRIACIPIEDEWIDEAGAELKSFPNAPFVVRFMKRHGLEPDDFDLLRDRIDEIKRCIRATDHPLRLDDLAAYLDELKAHGRQFVFLWRLKEGEQSYLAELADRGALARKLGDRRNRLNGGKLVWAWESEPPALAEVLHSGRDAEGTLRFKWVASRRYLGPVPPAVPGQPPAAPQWRRQRAVTFFNLDLRTGDCELRIQSLPNDGKNLPAPRKELETYRTEVERYVDLSRFSPVLVEPVANRWLREPARGLAVTIWSVVRPTGEYLNGGGGGAGIFSKLKLMVGDYFARRVTLKWECPQEVAGRPLFFTLDGEADSLELNGKADASRVDFLLDRIRQNAHVTLRMRELQQLAEKSPEHLRILASVDHFFATRKGLRVSAKGVAEDVWYPLATIQRVFALAAKEFPETFTLQGDVLVLRNRLRVREGGLAETLERFAKDRGYPAAQALVRPALSVLLLLALRLYEVLISWLLPEIFQGLTGIPSVALDLGLVASLGVMHLLVTFGGASVKAAVLRLLGFVRSMVRGLESLSPSHGQAMPDDTLEAVYQEWAASSVQVSRRRRQAPTPPPAALPPLASAVLNPRPAGPALVIPESPSGPLSSGFTS